MSKHSENSLNNHPHLQDRPPIPLLSIVVPVYNEEGNIEHLIAEIDQVLYEKIPYEIITIDDGSDDQSRQCLHNLAKRRPWLTIIRHKQRYGQSVAILTGVRAARASWIVTLDGDGQNDPADILRLFTTLHQPHRSPKLQMIIGYRQQRQDRWIKRWSSKIANFIRAWILHDHTPDTGCGLKLFSRYAFLALPHFNHMHRFLPALFLRNGGEVLSIEVAHRPREYGHSKYGTFNRLGVGIVDLLGVMWLQKRNCAAELIEENNSHDS